MDNVTNNPNPDPTNTTPQKNDLNDTKTPDNEDIYASIYDDSLLLTDRQNLYSHISEEDEAILDEYSIDQISIPAKSNVFRTAEDMANSDRIRSENTIQQYIQRVLGFYKISSDSRTIDAYSPYIANPLEVVDDLIKKSQSVSARTWTFYRAAMLWHLNDKRDVHPIYIEALEKIRDVKNAGIKRRNKKQVFDIDDFDKIINVLLTMNRRGEPWGSFTAFWLYAGIAAGARGVEWQQTSWLDETKSQLMIKNSKRKLANPAYLKSTEPSRSKYNVKPKNIKPVLVDDDEISLNGIHCGEYRIIRIDPQDVIYVNLHLAAIHENLMMKKSKFNISPEKAFKQYYVMCKLTLNKACKIAFKGKKQYTLHNTRSHFAALKKVDHSIGAVALMMGHSNTRTTMKSYGSRAAGLKGRRGQTNLISQIFREIQSDIPEFDSEQSTPTDFSSSCFP